jgi:hypothetical protein
MKNQRGSAEQSQSEEHVHRSFFSRERTLRGGFMTCRMNGRCPSAAQRLVPGGEPSTAKGRSPGSADQRSEAAFPVAQWRLASELPADSYGHSAGFPPASLFTRATPGTSHVGFV